MTPKKIEWKVGLFVFVGLILLALLMLNFSKGMSLFTGTYELRLRAENVAGIKSQAGVLMSGVKVGHVEETYLTPNGDVVMRLKIDDKFKIDKDARFLLDALGFLGDQYIAIISTNNSGNYLTNGQEVICEPAFNLQEAMQSTSGLLQQAQATMRTLDIAISNANRAIFNDATLTSFAESIHNIRTISSNANQTLGKIDRLVDTNGPVLNASVSNLHDFSTELKTLFATNQQDINVAVKNLRGASETVKELLAEVKATNGPAGLLLRDEQMKSQLSLLVTNLTSVAGNLGSFSSNLNQRGVWSMLWKPKTPKDAVREKTR